MKVLVDWVDTYPDLSLTFEGDEKTPGEKDQLARYGIEVPDELAQRWRATRDAWRKLDEEVQEFTGHDPGIGC